MADGMTDTEQQFFDTNGEQAPEVEAEVTPEVEAVKEPEAAKEPEKMVPLAALHEARSINKELKQEIAGNNDKLTKLESTFQDFVSKSSQDDVYDEDPDAQRDARLATLESNQQQNEQYQTNLNEYQRVMSAGRAQIVQYSATEPDVDKAYTHYVTSKQAELAAAGWGAEEITKQILTDDYQLLVRAAADGINPGERVMALARSRGFTGTTQAKAEKEIEQLDQGLQASGTLSNTGGQSSGGLTLESLAEMNGDEFDKAWSQLIG